MYKYIIYTDIDIDIQIYLHIYIYMYTEQKWDANLREMEIKCRDLLLEEHCEKLFCLMDSFWEEIAGANVDLNWLVIVRSHLDKIEKE